MGESKHTLKAWSVRAGVLGGRFCVWDVTPGAPERVIAKDLSEKEAYAVAAAPEMLEALRTLTLNARHRSVECEIGRSPRCICGLDSAIAAIAKAEGREP